MGQKIQDFETIPLKQKHGEDVSAFLEKLETKQHRIMIYRKKA